MPLRYLFLLLVPSALVSWPFKPVAPEKIIIILETAGDAIHPGRSLYDNFEAALTYALAQELKTALHQMIPQVKIMINRTPADIVAPLQNATFANRIDPFVYISIHACTIPTTPKPIIYAYNFSYNDQFIAKQDTLSCYTVDTIYLVHKNKTASFSHACIQALNQYQDSILTKGPLAIPFKPLLGIKPAALALEIGLGPNDNWHDIVQPLALSIAQAITHENSL